MSKPTDTHCICDPGAFIDDADCPVHGQRAASPRGQSPADRLIAANRILIDVHDGDIIDDPRLSQAIGILSETIAARQKAEADIYRTLYGVGAGMPTTPSDTLTTLQYLETNENYEDLDFANEDDRAVFRARVSDKFSTSKLSGIRSAIDELSDDLRAHGVTSRKATIRKGDSRASALGNLANTYILFRQMGDLPAPEVTA